jgi:phosphoribosylglycinamide formyltransferase 1
MIDDSLINTTASLISPQIYHQQISDVQPLKLGIMASGNGSNFEVIAQAIATGEINAQIQVLIYNNPDAKAAVRAENGA